MTVDVKKYADPLATGSGTGWDWANAYTSRDAALAAECANGQDYSNINQSTVTVTSAFATANQTITFTGSGATARLIDLTGTTLQYEVLTGSPLGTDTTITGATDGEVELVTIDDTSGGAVDIIARNSDNTVVNHSSTTITDAVNQLILSGDFAGAQYDSTKSELSVGNATALTIDTDYITLRNFQILWAPTTNSRRAISWTGTGKMIRRNMLLKCAATGGNYIRGIYWANGDLDDFNVIELDIKRGSNDYIASYNGSTNKTHRQYNCIQDNCYRGLWNNSSVATVAKNGAYNCNVTSGGTGTVTFTNCATAAGTGTNPVTVSDFNDPDYYHNRFQGVFSLAWQSALVGAGVGSSVDADVPSEDIFGNSRPAAATTDIGVHYDATQTTSTPLIELAFNESSGAVCENNYDSRLNAVVGEVLTVTNTSAAQSEYQMYSEDGTYAYIGGQTTPSVVQKSLDLATTHETNSTPYSGLPTSPNTPNAIGGGTAVTGLLYVDVGWYSGASWSNMTIAAYDTTLAGLPLDHYIDCTAEKFAMSGVAIDVAGDEALAVSYSYGSHVWRYDLTAQTYSGVIDLDIRIHCNGAYHEASSDTMYHVAKNQSGTLGAERIFQFDMAGAVIGSWCDPVAGEVEDIHIVSGSFKYNSFAAKRIYTSTKPAAPTRTAGSLHLSEQYYVDVFAKIPDECTICLGIKATTFKANNTLIDSHLGSSSWFADINASGVLSFNISGAAPVTYTLPSATTEYKVVITIEGSGVNRTVKLYVDDTLRDTQTQTWTAPPAEWWSLGAGNSNNTDSDVELFYFMFDNYAYSATEVTDYTPPALPIVSRSINLSLNSIVQSQLVLSASLDSRLMLQGVSTTSSVDSMLSKLISTSANTDAMLRDSLNLISSIDSRILNTLLNNISVDSMLQSNTSVSSNLDSILSASFTINSAIDSILESNEFSNASLDSMLQASLLTTTSVNAILSGGSVVFTDVSSLIQDVAQLISTLDSLVQQSKTITSTVDSILTLSGNNINTSIESVLQNVISTTISTDGVLQIANNLSSLLESIIVANINTSTSLNSILQKSMYSISSVDSVLQLSQSLNTYIDSVIITAHSVLSSIDSLISKSTFTYGNLDGIIIQQILSGVLSVQLISDETRTQSLTDESRTVSLLTI